MSSPYLGAAGVCGVFGARCSRVCGGEWTWCSTGCLAGHGAQHGARRGIVPAGAGVQRGCWGCFAEGLGRADVRAGLVWRRRLGWCVGVMNPFGEGSQSCQVGLKLCREGSKPGESKLKKRYRLGGRPSMISYCQEGSKPRESKPCRGRELSNPYPQGL